MSSSSAAQVFSPQLRADGGPVGQQRGVCGRNRYLRYERPPTERVVSELATATQRVLAALPCAWCTYQRVGRAARVSVRRQLSLRAHARSPYDMRQ